MNQTRIAAGFAVLTFALCVLIAVDPVTMANTILRREFAQRGDPAFTLFYRWVAVIGAVVSLVILIGDLWSLAQA